VETRSYDRAGRLTEVRNAKSGVTLSFASYAYDGAGNPTQMTTTEGTTGYAYDALDRLTEACFGSGCADFVRYTYDSVGNRLSEAKPAGSTTYSYNVGDQLTSRSGPGGSVGYGYDANGNQTQAGSRSFAWDLANRLASTTESGASITYGYDGDGTRLQAVAGGSTTRYLWDGKFGLPLLALERDGSGNTLRSYLYGNQLVGMDAGGSSFYFQRDGIGSTVNVTSSSGVAQWTYGYEPFGSARTQTQNQPAAPANPIRFTGEQLDATGLYHLRARQYDAASGRFLSLDPLAPALTDPYVAAYVYANNRPTALIDPSGNGAVSGSSPCVRLFSIGCLTDWVADDPFNHVIWPALEAVASVDACAAGIAVGAVGGPSGSVAGCIAVTTAFFIGAERAKEKIDELKEE
jgi:RHS repeat-associated protein